MRTPLALLLTLSCYVSIGQAAETPRNALSPTEVASGWKLLWDGSTSQGWRSARGPTFPDHGWTLADGTLSVVAGHGREGSGGGDIITVEKYSNFELSVDFRLT